MEMWALSPFSPLLTLFSFGAKGGLKVFLSFEDPAKEGFLFFRNAGPISSPWQPRRKVAPPADAKGDVTFVCGTSPLFFLVSRINGLIKVSCPALLVGCVQILQSPSPFFFSPSFNEDAMQSLSGKRMMFLGLSSLFFERDNQEEPLPFLSPSPPSFLQCSVVSPEAFEKLKSNTSLPPPFPSTICPWRTVPCYLSPPFENKRPFFPHPVTISF